MNGMDKTNKKLWIFQWPYAMCVCVQKEPVACWNHGLYTFCSVQIGDDIETPVLKLMLIIIMKTVLMANVTIYIFYIAHLVVQVDGWGMYSVFMSTWPYV